MAHEGYHEPYEQLPDSVRDMHRAIVSLQEELEAVDWYYQRAAVTRDPALREVLLHNAHEETEHAMMVLEWIRRHDPVFESNMRTYLFSEGPITEVEKSKKGGDEGGSKGGEAGSKGGKDDPPPAGPPGPRRSRG